jgi:hypothetical protein
MSASPQILTHALPYAPRVQHVSDQLLAPPHALVSAASRLTASQETGVVLLIKSIQQLAFLLLSLSANLLLATQCAQRKEFVLLTLLLLLPAHAI